MTKSNAAMDIILDVNRYLSALDNRFTIIVKRFNKELRTLEETQTIRRRSATTEEPLGKIDANIFNMQNLTSK